MYCSDEILRLIWNYGKLAYGNNCDEWNPNSVRQRYVFSATSGKNPLCERTIEDVFKNCMEEMTSVSLAMKEHLTPHSLRHTYAVNYLRAGGDLYTLSQLMGHADPKTTTIYAKLTGKEMVQAADKVVGYILGGE